MKLKELRISKGATQKEVANAIGCSSTVYSRYENGSREPDIQTICLIATYYDTSTDAVIGYKPHSKQNVERSFYGKKQVI